jgi:hypothetical protein
VKIKIDENIPVSLVRVLASYGYDVTTVTALSWAFQSRNVEGWTSCFAVVSDAKVRIRRGSSALSSAAVNSEGEMGRVLGFKREDTFGRSADRVERAVPCISGKHRTHDLTVMKFNRSNRRILISRPRPSGSLITPCFPRLLV